MTQDQIKAIAEEYAKQFDYDENYTLGLIQNEQFFLRWLNEKFCIVEREKVMELYDAIKFLNQIGCQDRLDLLESLFGTSMFNQNEE